MNEVFQRFVEGIVSETDSNQEEREDLYEELLSHLECSFIDYQKQGFYGKGGIAKRHDKLRR